jgi:hypothetical protein
VLDRRREPGVESESTWSTPLSGPCEAGKEP